MSKPNAPSCERNRDSILAVLREYLVDCKHVLEIGSGTGQHAVYFAEALPYLTWQTADVAENLPGIRLWLDEARLPNTPPPLQLAVKPLQSDVKSDVKEEWPSTRFDAVFSANTLHIMSWPEVELLFTRLHSVLADNAVLAIYGPFNYDGKFTSESNVAFNDWLKARGAHMGIRDFEAVNALAISSGLQLVADVAMPANNRMLVWRRDLSTS